MQALFAHVLMRLGWTIVEVKAKGHPDIRAVVHDSEVFVQVKAALHRTASSTIELSAEDAAGIHAMGGQAGWFAVLDCAFPIQWVVVDRSRAARLLGARLQLITLQANADVGLSTDCNEAFAEIVTEHQSRLSSLGYAVLRARALRGDGL